MTVVDAPTIEELLAEWLESIEGDLVAPIEAQKFVAQMRERHPGLLADWLESRAEVIVADRIRHVLGSQRAKAASRRGSRTFSEWTDKVEAGEEVPSILDTSVHVDGVYRPLRDMTAPDLEAAARDFDVDAKAARLEAAFLRAVKKRLPDSTSTVGDVLTEADVARIRFTKAR